MEDPHFLRGDNTEIAKIYDIIYNLSPRTTGPFSTKIRTKHPCENGTLFFLYGGQLYSNEENKKK